jgi:hypothetical protein
MKVSKLAALLKKQFEIKGEVILKAKAQIADPELTLENCGISEGAKATLENIEDTENVEVTFEGV